MFNVHITIIKGKEEDMDHGFGRSFMEEEREMMQL